LAISGTSSRLTWRARAVAVKEGLETVVARFKSGFSDDRYNSSLKDSNGNMRIGELGESRGE
jgi:hypothetical protein